MNTKFATSKKTNMYEINKTLANPVRISIIEALRYDDLSVLELSKMFEIDERLIQYHLRRLMRAGVVTEQRNGSLETYAVANPALAQTCHILYQLWMEQAVAPVSHSMLSFEGGGF